MNAFGAATPAHIPPASDYGDYDMFEDGIGIVRSYVDEFDEVCESGLAAEAAETLAARNLTARYIVGEAMQPFLDAMIAASPLAGRLVPLTVRNDYFGGNVNVTGLLTAQDIAPPSRPPARKRRTQPWLSRGQTRGALTERVPQMVSKAQREGE
ncbi:MAG: DUF512 domain-containing protein [Adlercreutzia equolifaciens]